MGRKKYELQPEVTIGGQVVRHRIETVYDANGRVATTISNVAWFGPGDGDVHDADARETSFVYDVYGNVVKTIFDDGTFTTATFDEFNRRQDEFDQLGNQKTFQYDPATGRLTGVWLPDLDPSATVTRPFYQYGYDPSGNQTSLIDPRGNRTTWTFDHAGRELSRTLPSGLTEVRTYDSRGRLAVHVSFEGAITQYGRVARVYSPVFAGNFRASSQLMAR